MTEITSVPSTTSETSVPSSPVLESRKTPTPSAPSSPKADKPVEDLFEASAKTPSLSRTTSQEAPSLAPPVSPKLAPTPSTPKPTWLARLSAKADALAGKLSGLFAQGKTFATDHFAMLGDSMVHLAGFLHHWGEKAAGISHSLKNLAPKSRTEGKDAEAAEKMDQHEASTQTAPVTLGEEVPSKD